MFEPTAIRRSIGAAIVCLLYVLGTDQHVAIGGELSWPPSTDGLAFLWENGGESNTIPGDGSVGTLCRLVPSGKAKFNRFWAMDVTDGAYRAEDAMNESLPDRFRESDQLTLECVVTPARSNYSRPAHVVSYGKNATDVQFVLAQRGNILLFGAKNPESGAPQLLDVGKLSENMPHHVIISCRSSDLASYINGQAAASYAANVLDSSASVKGRLSFGQAADGSAEWAGSIEGVGLYSRSLSRDEVGQHYLAYAGRLKERHSIPQLELSARLTEKRTIPKAEVYPNSLVVFDYRVNSVMAGNYGNEKILVAHWGNLNGIRQKATRGLRTGRHYRLKLEPLDEHPELSALQIVMNEDDLLLPTYYAISDPVGAR